MNKTHISILSPNITYFSSILHPLSSLLSIYYQVGDRGMVTWRNGTDQLLAIVVDRRPADYWKRRKKKNGRSTPTPPPTQSSTNTLQTTNIVGTSENGTTKSSSNGNGNEIDANGKNATVGNELDQLKADEIHYYIHYHSYDR